MGCLSTRFQRKNKKSNEKKSVVQYSWEKRKVSNINPSDYIIENKENHEEIRIEGSVNGQQFIIQNCKDSTLYILDHINTITIDDCVNCKFILGPVKGCVFLRNCKECVCLTACGQFRTRDCRKLNIFLFCATQPIIEASTGIRFGEYQLYYNNIHEHLVQTGLNILSRDWEIIHDFTPVEGETNWSFMEEGSSVEQFVKPPQSEEVKESLSKVQHAWKTVVESDVINCNEPQFVMETTI